MNPVLGVSLLLIGSALTGLFVWWLLFATEGVYLGRRVVVWLYDVYARRYDGIKNYDDDWEAETLAEPIIQTLWDVPTPLILDVATGTARLPLTLLRTPSFKGSVIGLDYSRRMLTMAAAKLTPFAAERRPLIYQPAQKLPFADATFDGVTCLEALEFMPDPLAVIGELVRVVRPGGLIVITNRKGTDARLMPGKTWATDALVGMLRERFSLQDVRAAIWQVDYALIWAVKPGIRTPAPAYDLKAIVLCPVCEQHAWESLVNGWQCSICGAHVACGMDGVLELATYGETN